MQAFDALKRFFRPTDATIALPGDPFIVIDRERAIERLDLDKRAEKNGQKNYPPSESTTFDAVEAEIEAEIAEYANRAQIDAQANHTVYSQRLSELALLRELSSITGASVQTLGDFKATVIDRQNRLTLARDAIAESFQELADFKRVHCRSGPAHKGMLPIYAWSTIVLSWLVEAIANTAFLRINDDFGLIGGFVAAVIVAAVNVFGSAFVGRKVWPYLFHKDTWRRGLAIGAVIGWLLLLIIWNLLAAHFRDAKAAGMDAPEVAALALFQNAPFGLTSIYSYGLLFAGLLFAFLSAGAAFAMDDPYPGYGAIYRRHEDRCEEYADLIAEALDDLKITRDDGIEAARSIRDQLGTQFSERGQILAARLGHRERFNEYQDYLETIANTLFEHYRSANIQIRTDAPPSHFGKKWQLRRTELPVPIEPSIDAEVAQAQAALDNSIKEISEAYVTAIGSFVHLDEIKRSLANGQT